MTTRHFVNIERIVQPSKTPLPVLRGEALNVLPYIENAYISVSEGRVSSWGNMKDFDVNNDNGEHIDLSKKWVLPSWVDSHTHAVFAAYRSNEFEMRLSGMSYQEIAAAGGGILNSALKLGAMNEDTLFEEAKIRIKKIISKGTGALEIKSGYGLSEANELKMLRVIQRLKSWSPIPIKSTFLGAHAIPISFKNNRTDYIDILCHNLIPLIGNQKLADYCDVFCETGYFTSEETERIISTAAAHGLPSKIHTNQFTSIGGIQVAIKHKIKSVDHLEVMTTEDIRVLGRSSTIGTLLPIAPFFLNDPYPEGRSMVENNVAVALASDYNPGSAPSFDMTLAVSLACIKCGLTPTEAFNAATVNGAHSIDLENEVGSITPGLRANFGIYSSMDSISEIPYRICSELLEKVIIDGEIYSE